MKTLLLFAPTPSPSPSYFGPPYGVALLGAILKRAGQEVIARDYDGSTVAAMEEDLPKVIAEHQPDLIGISCLSVNRGSSIAAARRLKAVAPNTPIIVGGPFPTLYPEVMFRRAPIDVVCIGDGDETLLEVSLAIAKGGDLKDIAGLMIRNEDGSLHRTAQRPRFTDMDSLPYPDMTLFDVPGLLASHVQPEVRRSMARLRIEEREPIVSDAMMMVMTSRGCAWSCSFCPLSKWEGKTLFHSPGYVADMIEHYLANYGHRTFVFGDNTLSYPKKRIIALCDEIIARGLDIDWICMTRADMIDETVLGKMAAAGCKEISYGIESLDPAVQKAMGKKLSVHRAPPAFALTHAAGISSCMMMMVGNEGETRETMRTTVGAARDVQPDRVLIWTTKVYPGTRLWDHAVQQGVIPPGYLDDDFSEALDYTGENDAGELRHLERMLQPRTTYVPVPDPAASGGREALEKGLLMGIWRGSSVVLGGAHDPLGRDDLPGVVAWGRERGLRALWLHTDAQAMAQKLTRWRVQEVADNVLAGLIVPLFAPGEREHDRRVGASGALRATRKGILSWTRNNKSPVRAWCYLDKDNVGHAAAWVEWLHGHGVREASFIFGADPAGWQAVPAAELPSVREAGAAVLQAWRAASALDIAVDVVGLPECVLTRGEESLEVHELGRPFDELVGSNGAPEARSAARRAAKTLPPACARCKVAAGCEGVWADYVALRGDHELVPVPVDSDGDADPAWQIGTLAR